MELYILLAFSHLYSTLKARFEKTSKYSDTYIEAVFRNFTKRTPRMLFQ